MKILTFSKKDYNKTILISSMGRSGSTLLNNLLNCNSDFRGIFEPFFPEKVALAKPFIYPLYIRPENKDRKYLVPARKILTGTVKNQWTEELNTNQSSKKLLIKDIRINLFLKWINTHFPNIEIILLMRNPFAVADSWINANFGDGSRSRSRIIAQKELINDFLQPFKHDYLAIDDAYLRAIFFWCIYYYVPLKQFNPKDISIICYENLITNLDEELRYIINNLHIEIDFKHANQVLNKPTHTTRKSSDLLKPSNTIRSWANLISNSTIDRGYEIMSLFNMENFYRNDGTPDKHAIVHYLQ
ncbi:sulfotransferase [Candidatus Scalindua japonica]|uniref:Sulfotransferase n=1 Tax=Candidatus Scalindua japonica TaxID=1284222 RepID=A0A286U4D5_9BACT|nr:sulfotransferase [Candidatus Scalindua japonica]GAX62974.1 sulfotransferase [Candidatus Scalindua japonica]